MTAPQVELLVVPEGGRTGPPWLIDHLPDPLIAFGPLGLMWWQWIGVGVGIVLAWAIGRAVARVLHAVLRRAVATTSVTWDDEIVERVRRPLRWLASTVAAQALLPILYLPPGTQATARSLLLAASGFGLVWGALAVVDAAAHQMKEAEWAKTRPASRSLLLLASRVVKVVLVAIALIAFLGSLGVPIASLVAGLGIGGIALAFGAQKTVENLFGTFSIGVDQPLREGDFVRVGDLLGTVEAIGLRSTRIRTLDRTIVSLPNGKLSEDRIETFGLRDRCRFTATIGVVYGTTEAQMREVLAGFEKVLRDHPAIWPDAVVVKFLGFGQSSLDIEIIAWFVTNDFNQFRAWREEVLLAFMGVVERAGTSFAFPTRTIHMVQTPPKGS